ncbi:hypothetical protein C922_03199 [Plasmodium inui San Antonio 1]|uniref:Uncharacterized protein n=1 Tax=Plasmodium inui San Antonio 1 TaxID=1237626 RepID=W7A4Q7_9APIC|nr:hypothetical protein C922_03199 [Plasmodium inui San Antonio 1]EUD66283.1 hypothetical protein C922_03199 [Plasmodium inui San Antonio 1]
MATAPQEINIGSYGPQIETMIREAFKACVTESQKACQRNYVPAVVMAVLIFNALVFIGNKLGRKVI